MSSWARRTLDSELTVELRAWDILAMEAAGERGKRPTAGQAGAGGLGCRGAGERAGFPGYGGRHVAHHKPLRLRNVCETLIT